MKIAIMQPYFIPYPAYFRLFLGADLVVMYDCVQFVRRGYIHRNLLLKENNKAAYLTLPIIKKPVNTLICELEFRENATDDLKNQINAFPILQMLSNKMFSIFHHNLFDTNKTPVDYIIHWLKCICEHLNIVFNIEQSSHLKLPAHLKGEDRIMAIIKHFNAKEYINSPGGTQLYNKNFFNANDVKLKFLIDDNKKPLSILHYLLTENKKALMQQIKQQVNFQ